MSRRKNKIKESKRIKEYNQHRLSKFGNIMSTKEKIVRESIVNNTLKESELREYLYEIFIERYKNKFINDNRSNNPL